MSIRSSDELFIGGEWIAPSTSSVISVRSATTEEVIGSFPEAGRDDIDAAVQAARTAFDDPTGWSAWSSHERADAMLRLARALEERREDTALSVSAQNGMPVSIARHTEAVWPSTLLRYYANLIRSADTEEIRPSKVQGRTVVRKAPVGVVAAIVPWNFPQSLTAFKVAPALAAGCTIVIKPSPETVLDAYLLAEAVSEAGIPPGVVNIIPGGRLAGKLLVDHPGVDKVAFTGSTASGRAIAERCGRLLKPVTLELGGKSAGILLEDVDLSAAIASMFTATMLNNGQTCFLSTRILVPDSRYGEMVDALTAMVSRLRVGDALDPATQVGPLVSSPQRTSVEKMIAAGVTEGARITTGGNRPAGFDRGWFIEPTVLADVENHFAIAQQEVFGPVLCVIRYHEEREAVAIANDSAYGLGGTVWTSDPERGLAVARRIHAGAVGVNGFTLDHGAPFGGVKHSGIGRELGPEGLTHYQQLKSIYLPA